MLDFGAVRCNALDQWRKGAVKEHHLVFGVVDDVDQLLRMQARIAGVHYHAAARDGVIRFQMAVVVPRDRADRTALLQTGCGQRAGQLPGAHRAISVGVTKQGAVRLARDDFHITKLRRTVLQNAGN